LRALAVLGVGAAACLAAGPAWADLRLCNMTAGRVGVALGYRDAQGWVTEGWWNLNARGCETLLTGPLAARFYYIYAVDYDRAASGADARSCAPATASSRSGASRIASPAASTAAASSRIDTGEQKSWTIQLTIRPGRAVNAAPEYGGSEGPGPAGPPYAGENDAARCSGLDEVGDAAPHKIIATVGPASESPEMMARLFEAARTCSAST
jgi:uncharacterized membrane protein